MKFGAVVYPAIYGLFLVGIVVWGQATVDESRESVVLNVDASKGSDSNDGVSAPLKTISAAVAIAKGNNKANIGTKVIINAGTYRESILINTNLSGQTTMPITLQAATNGTVIVSGAVQYTGWSPYSQNASIYFTSWPNSWGYCPADTGNAPFESPIVNRREMIAVNGTVMTQVLTLAQMIYPGTFFVDETAGLVYVWPPSGTNMASADVEVATNPNPLMIQSNNGQVLNGVVIRGLTFQYGNPCHSDAAVMVTGTVTNILFDTDTFQWNNGHGLMLNQAATNVTVTNSTSNHNGAAGFQEYQVKNISYKNVQASYNNWRGAQGVYYTWNTGGLHPFSVHTETVSGATLTFNQTHSIHWDTNNENMSIDSVLVSNNVLGVSIEKNDGPITITNSKFCNIIGDASAGGLIFRNSQNTAVNNNILYNQSPAEIIVSGSSVAGGILISNWDTGATYNVITQGLTLTNNTVVNASANQVLFQDGPLGGADWTAFQSTLMSDHNTWWNASNASAFTLPYPSTSTVTNFSGWQSATAQGTSSKFAAPATDPATACATTADMPDFWLLGDSQTVPADASGNAIFPLTLFSLGGLSGTVKLSTDLSPMPGATATFTPSTVSLSANSTGRSSLTISTTGVAAGTYTVTVLANVGNITRSVALSVVVSAAGVRLSSTSVNFGNVTTATTGAPQTVTLTNVGSSALSITGVTAPTTGFTQTNTCGTSVAPGASCTFSLTFTPTKAIAYSKTLTINDSDPTSPQKVTLTGVGIAAPLVSLSNKSLTFSSTKYLSSSAAKTVTLTNAGTGALNINSITVTGTNSSDFTQTNTCPASVAVSGTCTITITFTPTGTGTRSASISIADNEVTPPAPLTLSGTETAAITISSKSLTYSTTVKVGNKSTAKTVTITNGSTAAIPISSFSFTGANASDFSQTNTCGATLRGQLHRQHHVRAKSGRHPDCDPVDRRWRPGEPANSDAYGDRPVTFKPAGASRNASLTMTDNPRGALQTAPLSGTGVAGHSYRTPNTHARSDLPAGPRPLATVDADTPTAAKGKRSPGLMQAV